MKTLAVVLNPSAGSARAFGEDDLREAIKAAASWAELEFFDASDDVPGAARAACASGADAVVTAGGDGTAAAVLDAARDAGCAIADGSTAARHGEYAAAPALWRS